MLVQCPSCLTNYKVSDSLITAPNPTLRCSRCKHIFILGAQPDPSTPSETGMPPDSSVKPKDDSELSFSFPPSEKSETFEERPDVPVDPEPEEQATPSPPAPAAADDYGSAALDTLREEPVRFEQSREMVSSSDEPEPIDKPSAPDNPHYGSPIPTIVSMSLLALLVVIYALLALTHQTKPDRVEDFLKAIPGLSSSVFRNNHLRRGITLKSVTPSFQTIRGNREVFVISGLAVNQNLLGVRDVRIEGTVYDAEGKEMERQAITIGNPISLKIIKAITAQDISTLQKLRPPQRFEIHPQDSAAFIIVFLKPIREIKTFRYQILSAEGTT